MFQNDVQGVLALRDNIEKRACELAVYIIENRTTIRAAAKVFGVSKSTVHKDLTQRLETCNHGLYLQVKQVLEVNKAERHIRGGLATRQKYRRARTGFLAEDSDQTAVSTSSFVQDL